MWISGEAYGYRCSAPWLYHSKSEIFAEGSDSLGLSRRIEIDVVSLWKQETRRRCVEAPASLET